MIPAAQTLLSQGTPPALVYSLPAGAQSSLSRKLSDVLEAIEQNWFVPPAGDHPLSATWERINALYDLGENWNGYDVAAPHPDAVEQSKRWLERMYAEAQEADLRWVAPHVSANEDGDVVFEWRQGHKRLSVYVSPKEAWHIKAWGPSVSDEMADGSAERTVERIAIWTWLVDPADDARR